MSNGTVRRSISRAVALGVIAVLLATLGAAPATAQADDEYPLPEQPDMHVSKNGRTYVGDNLYNKTGAGQTLSRNAARGTTVRFYVRMQNDGDQATDVRFQGCAGNRSFAVRYFGVTPVLVDYTSQVVAGATGLLPHGSTLPWMVEVKVKRAAAAGATLNCKFKVSATGTGLSDAIVMTVRRS